jgi:REP element-mobilizing transposase RayT
MAHSYVSVLVHCVFSTKERKPLLAPPLRERLFPYMGGIARDVDLRILGIGGVETHTHFLLSLSSTMSVSKAVQLLKGNSSKWIHDTFPERAAFAWQEGYGAFSIGVSQEEDTLRYIANQEEHHQKRTFEEEFRAILEKHWIEYDEEFVFG